MPPQNLHQARVWLAAPLTPPQPTIPQVEDYHPPPAAQVIEVVAPTPVQTSEQNFMRPETASQRAGIAPHAGDYHASPAPTARLLLPAHTQTVAEPVKDSRGLAISGLLLAFVCAPVGLVVSSLALMKRRTKATKVISSLGLVFSLAGISLAVMFALAINSSFATVRGHNADMVQQGELETVQNQLQAAFIRNGTYPSVAQLNDRAWRTKNLTGLTAADLSPSVQPTSIVGGKPTTNAYAYNTVPANCSGTTESPCNSFTLSALMSTGQIYSIQ